MDSAVLNKMAKALKLDEEYILSDPDPLQPTANFLDYASRDIRRHFCIISDEEGNSFFLRPDFTLPIAVDYAKLGHTNLKKYFYNGNVWLWNSKNNKRTQQAQMGIEHIGIKNASQNIAETINATYQALKVAGHSKPFLRMGDPALFDHLIDLLELPKDWQIRLQKLFRRNTGLDLFFKQAQQALKNRVINTTEIECNSLDELETFLKKNKINHIGQRGLDEIQARLVEQKALHNPKLPQQVMQIIKNFLKIKNSHPKTALADIESFAKTNNINFDGELNRIYENWHKMKKLPLGEILTKNNVSFSTHFQGAHLSYYTGFVFAFLRNKKTPLLLAGGGQYNGLMKALNVKNGTGFGSTIYLDELA